MSLTPLAGAALGRLAVAIIEDASPDQLCSVPDLDTVFPCLRTLGTHGAGTLFMRELAARAATTSDQSFPGIYLAHPLLAAEPLRWADGVLFMDGTHSGGEIVCAYQGDAPLYWLSASGLQHMQPASEVAVNEALVMQFTPDQNAAREALMWMHEQLAQEHATESTPPPHISGNDWRTRRNTKLDQLHALLTCKVVGEIPPLFMSVYHDLGSDGVMVAVMALLWNMVTATETKSLLASMLASQQATAQRMADLLAMHCPRLPTSV